MTTLTFRANAIPAALHLIANTCLGYAPDTALKLLRISDPLAVYVNDTWPWSSGEANTLIPLLHKFATCSDDCEWCGSEPTLDVDSETRKACGQALTIAASTCERDAS